MPAVYPAFFFFPEKGSKSAGNAVIPTYPTHWSHGLQYLRHKRPTFAFTSESGYTLGFRRKIAHSGLHAETGALRTGVVSLPSDCFTRFGNPAWPGIRTANFAAFGSWSEALLKNAESLRDSDALMRVAVPRRRGPAGLRRPTPPAERTVPAPISPRVQLCLRRPAFPLSAFIPGA